MKKSYLLGAALMALTCTSCTQDDSLNLIGDDSVFTGEMEYVGSRTSLGEGNKISWVKEDELSIFQKNTINRHYKVSSIDNGTATFTYLDNVTPGTVESISAKYAVYPYSDANTITSAGVISAPIKDLYTYENRSSFISSALMASTSTGTNFSFKNVQGYLRLRLCAVIPEDYKSAVESVTLTSSKALSGTAAITFGNDGIPTTNIKTDGAGNSLSVKLKTPQHLSTKASGKYVELYVPVVPMTFDADEITLTINFEDGTTFSKSNGKAITITRREVTGMMLEIGEDEDFTGDIEGVEEAWDGETVTIPTPVVDETTNEKYYPVVKASDLAGLAALVNGTSSISRASVGKINVKLISDIDLGGHEWTPIGLNQSRFVGTFDGNGHTIKNLKISTYENGSQAALFGDVNEATIKNLVFDNAQILYPGSDDFYAAVVVSQAYCVTLQNITVKNSTIQGNNKVAAILAQDADGAAMIIDNCHVENSTIETKNETDGGNAGGIVGSIQGSGNEKKISNSSVKNCTFNVVNSVDAGKRSNGQMVGTVIATDATKVVLENCEVEGNTFNQTGVTNYTSCYDGIFVGGARTEVIGQVIINGISYDNFVAKIGEAGYTTLQKAVDAAQDGGTIILVEDIKQKEGVLITDKKVTIDLNSKTFTISEGANTNNRNIKVNGSSVVTIKNGSMVAAGNYSSGAYGTLRTEGTANVTLENVKLYNYRGNGLNVKACTGTVVTINNTEVYSQYGGGIEAAGGTIELNDVTVEQEGMYTAPYNSMAISVNGGGQVTVNSGTYTTKCLTAEEANNQGTSHGPWAAGVLNSGGTLIINGGTFTNDNFGDNTLATAARGLLLADTGANIQINGGIFNAVKAIIDVTNNLGDASKNPSVTLAGGTFSADPRISGLYASNLIQMKEGYVVKEGETEWKVVEFKAIAKIGDTEYDSIEEAIANWTNNTTLTLLSNVTLTDVVTLKSTEHHILNLGTYTMTAASGNNAIVIKACGTGDAERTAITIKADANNPGGIHADNKSIIYYKYADGGITGNDRPIIKIEGGVFTGSTSSWGTAGIYTIGSEARKCATLNISGGIFNCSINGSGKSKLLISGGVFHYSVGSQGDSTALRLISGGTFKTLGFMTADNNNTKFWFGTSMGKSDVGLYINDDNYLVVGGPVISEFGDKFQAKATNATKWSSYLTYSSAATNGLYYTNADMAIEKHGENNVKLNY